MRKLYVKQIMAEELANLYTTLYSPQTTNEQRTQVTARLLELYKLPETILALLQLISQSPLEPMKRAAAIGLRNCIKNNWEELTNTPQGEMIKTTLLQVLSNEHILLVAKNIIESCEILFEAELNEQKTEKWTDIFSFIQTCSQSPNSYYIVLYLVANIARYLGTHVIEQNLQLFNSLAAPAVNSSDLKLIASVMEMLGVVISYVGPSMIQECIPQFQFMLQTFPRFLKGDPDLLRTASYALADAFQCDSLPIPATDILNVLLSLVQNPEIPPECYQDIFIAVQHLIKFHADELVDVMEDLVKSIIVASAATFVDAFYIDNSDSTLIASTAGDLAGELQHPKFLKMVLSLSSMANNDVMLLSYALVLYNVLDECENEMLNDIQTAVNVTISFLNSPNLYVKEIGSLTAKIIADGLEPSQIELATILMQALLPIIGLGNEYLTTPAFDSLIAIFNQGLLKSEFIQPVLQVLISVIQNPAAKDFHHISIEAIASLIFAVEEDIAPFAPQIFPIIMQAASIQTNDPGLLNVKQQAIIAIGMLLRFSPQVLENNIAPSLDLIFSIFAADPSDMEMAHSILFALGNLVIAHFPVLMNYKDKIIELIDYNLQYLINHVINYDDIQNDEEKEAKEFNISIRGFTDTLYLIKWIFKQYNELSPDSPTQWMATILAFMSAPVDELQTCSIVAGYYGTSMIMRNHQSDPGLFLKPMIELFGSEYPNVVGKCFAAFNHLIQQQIPIDPSYIKEAVQAGFHAIHGTLPCQKKKSFDFHSSKHVYRFFMTFTRVDPQNFPIKEYIQSGKKLMSNERQLYEISQYIEVLNIIYEQFQVQSLSKKFLLNNIEVAFTRYAAVFTDEDVDYKAFSVPPSPLASMSMLLRVDPPSFAKKHDVVINLVQCILSAEPSTERFYNATISNAIVFLCISLQTSPGNFDIGTWFPLILSKLPLKQMGDENLSEKIYSTILPTLQNPDILQQFGPEFLRFLAQTLGYKNRQFARFEFSQETLNLIVTNITHLMQVSGNTPESMKQLFTDEQSYQRFCQRMTPASQ
ncbi:hypothetical protein TRFO_34682 [Tritrichomonas foetus]|uniref:Importin N-terminal domain-containing protein n=1 Tax=Tritrichomonas foetus TaxID=1144522 RepID=A0A1J4JII5_9EUKA|nr:hypothetical protein TRFO_34682 [Tritrichomonas foetus]|eukprot:OHS98954.1 hypothetical protein TRFO_34682 [Tritrichomonas foetus]